MPFPISNIEEDPFDPYAEEYNPPAPEDDYNEYAVRPLTTPMDTETLYNLYQGSEGLQRPSVPPYERGMIDSPEYWMSDQMLGAGSMRPRMQEWDYRGSVGSPPTTEEPWTRPGADGHGPVRESGLTPPYGTRREPVTNPITQDRRHVDQFIDDTDQREEYANMPEVARDVNEQGDMIRGAAPRMRTREIMRLLEEQMKGQGFMLPPPMEDYIQPEDEEEVFRGRRFG